MDDTPDHQDVTILIETKLQSPKLTKSNISRERFVARFAAEQSESALFVAATGYGKSTLMRQLFDETAAQGQRVGWLGLDGLDNRPTVFLAYFVRLLTEAGVIDAAELFQQTSMTDPEDLDRAFELLSRAAARVNVPTALFFDDFHCIDSPVLLRGCGRFLDSASTDLRAYVAARATPRLEIQRREMEGRLVVIDAAQMKFSQIEAERFFEKSLDQSLLPSDVSNIMKSTEGWAAGLQIATASIVASRKRIGQIPARFRGSKERVARYLYDNVMENLPDDVRDFLLSTAPLRRFSVPMCEYVRGQQGNRKIVQWLIDTGLFIIALDEDATWFRYHHLFAEFLTETAQQDPAFQKADIYRRASEWCLEFGYLDEAIHYLLDIRDFDEAARLISESAPRIARQQGDNTMLIRWIEALPASYHNAYPAMMLDYAFSLAFTHSTPQALTIVRQVKDRISSEAEFQDILAYAETVEALALAAQDDRDAALAKIKDTRKRWPGCEAGVLGILCNIAAYCQMAAQNPDIALREAMDGRVLGMRAGLRYVWLWADCIEVMVHCRTGNLTAAHEALRRALSDAVQEGENTLLGLMVHMLSANLAYLQGDLSTAKDELALGTGFSATYGPLEPLLISHKVRAGLAALEGQDARVMEVLERGQSLGLRNGLPGLAFVTLGMQISFLARRGNAAEAHRLATQWGVFDGSWQTRFKGSHDVIAVWQKRIRAELALAEGRFADAVQILEDLERRLKFKWPQDELLCFAILKSHGLSQSDRYTEAARELSRAADQAHRLGLVAPFLEFADFARPVLQKIVELRRAAGTDSELIAQSGPFKLLQRMDPETRAEADPSEKDDDLWVAEELTNREIELLQLIESGMTNAQLAAHLVLSVATVKWHLHNVFQKLGVKNRMGALAKARKHGLI
ncbi:LuxR C-terminal-related transcriptional regulator [Ruegeria sp. HKCCD7255]|uniref:LuxR C-terminal-related transcriptional regulator n=1 Tax=Ruegeria sp. HKCCD7255 TaxID=2683004 RepID=UPI0014891068|nr:LuxR C-terminal-related transcriptional regulator [Ruegeria sp. HKCCD7255]